MEFELVYNPLKTIKYPRVVLNGFLYCIHKKSSHYLRWKCNKGYSMGCPSILKTSLDLNNLKFIAIEHNHVHPNDEDSIVDLKTKVDRVKKQIAHNLGHLESPVRDSTIFIQRKNFEFENQNINTDNILYEISENEDIINNNGKRKNSFDNIFRVKRIKLSNSSKTFDSGKEKSKFVMNSVEDNYVNTCIENSDFSEINVVETKTPTEKETEHYSNDNNILPKEQNTVDIINEKDKTMVENQLHIYGIELLNFDSYDMTTFFCEKNWSQILVLLQNPSKGTKTFENMLFQKLKICLINVKHNPKQKFIMDLFGQRIHHWESMYHMLSEEFKELKELYYKLMKETSENNSSNEIIKKSTSSQTGSNDSVPTDELEICSKNKQSQSIMLNISFKNDEDMVLNQNTNLALPKAIETTESNLCLTPKTTDCDNMTSSEIIVEPNYNEKIDSVISTNKTPNDLRLDVNILPCNKSPKRTSKSEIYNVDNNLQCPKQHGQKSPNPKILVTSSKKVDEVIKTAGLQNMPMVKIKKSQINQTPYIIDLTIANDECKNKRMCRSNPVSTGIPLLSLPKRSNNLNQTFNPLQSVKRQQKLPPPAPKIEVRLEYPGGRLSHPNAVLTWNLKMNEQYELLQCFEIYSYHAIKNSTRSNKWILINVLKALPLPMKCTLKLPESKNIIYYFAVRAIDILNRRGQFSSPECISLT